METSVLTPRRRRVRQSICPQVQPPPESWTLHQENLAVGTRAIALEDGKGEAMQEDNDQDIVFEKQQCGELDGTNGHDRNKNDPDGEVESSRLVQEDSLFQPSLLSPAL